MSVYFGQKASFGSRTPTRAIPTQTATTTPPPMTPHAKRKNIGAIVGGTIGGLAAFTLLIGVAYFCLRKHKRKHRVPGDSIPATALTQTNVSKLGSPTTGYGSEATFVATVGHESRSPASSPVHSHTPSSSYPSPTKQQATPPMFHPAHAPSPMEYYPPPDSGRPQLFHPANFEMPTVRESMIPASLFPVVVQIVQVEQVQYSVGLEWLLVGHSCKSVF